MNDEQNKLDGIKPVEFTWSSDNANMSHTGIVAQEIDIINSELNTTVIDLGNYGAATDVISFGDGNIDLNSITISGHGSNAYSFAGGSGMNITNSISGVNEINTASGKKIDLDELSDVLETVKKRLLILAPNFELHEKYPMLKEMYDEYKAMERLLGGPDRNTDEDL